MSAVYYGKSLVDYAWAFIGLPYTWGGDDPIKGFDCSGFAIEVLRSKGLLPLSGDWSAHGIWELFESKRREVSGEGYLVFWWNKDKTRIRHIEICVDDVSSIGASGGGSSTTDSDSAALQNAYIKVRPILGRGDIAGFARAW